MLANSLIPVGTTGIVASVVPVNDTAAVPLMIALYRELLGAASLAEALRDARRGPDLGHESGLSGVATR